MANENAIAFAGTREQEQQLREVIAKHKDTRGALIPILHEAQEIYGYLPIEVQTIISEEARRIHGGDLRRCNILYPVQHQSEGQV